MGRGNRRIRQGLSMVLIAVVTLAAMGVPTIHSHAQQCINWGFPAGSWHIDRGVIINGQIYDQYQLNVTVNFPQAQDPVSVRIFGGSNNFSMSAGSPWEIDYTSYASLNGLQIESYRNYQSGGGLHNFTQAFNLYPSKAIQIIMRGDADIVPEWDFWLQTVSICSWPVDTLTPSASVTLFDTFTPTNTPTPTSGPTSTPTPLPPTNTPTATRTPSRTWTPSPTHTPLPPTNTPTPSDTPPPGTTPTNTPIPSNTLPPTGTPTPTAIPPSDTMEPTGTTDLSTAFIDPLMFATVKPPQQCSDVFNPCGALPFGVPPFPTIYLPSPTGLPVTPFLTIVPVGTSTGTVTPATPATLTTAQAAVAQFATNAQGAAAVVVITPGLSCPPGTCVGGIAEITNSASQVGATIGDAFGIIRSVQGFFIGKTGAVILFLLLVVMFIVLVRIIVFAVPIIKALFSMVTQLIRLVVGFVL